MSITEKSVCVSSLEVGPRSLLRAGAKRLRETGRTALGGEAPGLGVMLEEREFGVAGGPREEDSW